MPRVQLVSDIAVFNDASVRSVLLVRYRRSGYDTGWYLPDTLLNQLEHPDAAANRILTEQLGTTVSSITLSHVESFEDEGLWHLTFHYIARSGHPIRAHASSDIADYRWFAIDELPDPKDVGLNGWALKTIEYLLKRS